MLTVHHPVFAAQRAKIPAHRWRRWGNSNRYPTFSWAVKVTAHCQLNNCSETVIILVSCMKHKLLLRHVVRGTIRDNAFIDAIAMPQMDKSIIRFWRAPIDDDLQSMQCIQRNMHWVC